MGIILTILSAILYTAANYFGELYILNWFALLPFFYYIFKVKKIEEMSRLEIFLKGAGLGFFILLFSGNFLYYSISFYTAAPFLIIMLLLVLLFMLLSLIYGLFLSFYFYLQQRLTAKNEFHPYLFAAVWTIMEFSRHYLLGFFPVANPAYTQAEFLPFIQLAEYGGIWILTFLLILVNSLLYEVVFKKKKRDILAIVLIFLVIFTFGVYRGNIDYNKAEEENTKIGIITTQIEQRLKWKSEQLDQNIKILLDSASELNNAQLIIAPETNLTFDFYSNSYYQREVLAEIAKRFKVPVQIGALASKDSFEGRFNSSFLISKNGEILSRYDKNRLLYFGENYPFEGLLNKITPYHFSSLNAGNGSGYFQNGDLKWKTVICSEILYPEYVKIREEKVDFIINQTNEGWFNNSRLLKNIMWQAAVIRAVENRIPVIKTGNQAYNGIIYPAGNYRKVRAAENYHLLKIN